MTCTRGTTNTNERGNTKDRAARRKWLVETFRSDVDLILNQWGDVVRVVPAALLAELVSPFDGMVRLPTCRCYRCGRPLTEDTVSPDRIKPGVAGGRYTRDNIRPSCDGCQIITGNQIRAKIRAGALKRYKQA